MKRIIILLFILCWGNLFAQKSITTVAGNFSQLNDGDTVRITVNLYGEFPALIEELNKNYYGIAKNHGFKIIVPLVDHQIYQCILDLPRQVNANSLRRITLQKGDHLYVSGTALHIDPVRGKGAERINISTKLTAIYFDPAFRKAINGVNSAADLAGSIPYEQKLLDSSLSYLARQKTAINTQSYEVLKLEAMAGIWSTFWHVYYLYDSPDHYRNHAFEDSVRAVLTRLWLPLRKKYVVNLNSGAPFLCDDLVEDYALHQIIRQNDFSSLNYDDELKNKYLSFKSAYTGPFREKILTYLILNAHKSNEISYCYHDAVQFIKNPDFRLALNNHCQCLPGAPAYDFSLQDTSGFTRHLSDYKGKVVIIDFWFTGCGNCRELTPYLAKVEKQFEGNSKVVFISISSDKTLSRWKSGIKSGFYISSPQEINLYTGGRGETDPVFSRSNTAGAPTLRMVDQNGNWLPNPTDCRFDDGKDLVNKINLSLNKH